MTFYLHLHGHLILTTILILLLLPFRFALLLAHSLVVWGWVSMVSHHVTLPFFFLLLFVTTRGSARVGAFPAVHFSPVEVGEREGRECIHMYGALRCVCTYILCMHV